MKERLSHQLSHILIQLEDGKACRLGAILDAAQIRSFGILLQVLAIPGALPLFYSLPFGLMIVWIGIQLILGIEKPILLEKIRQMEIRPGIAARITKKAIILLSIMERWTRPRLFFIQKKLFYRLIGFFILFMGILISLPIPLTHTLPAIVIFCLGVAITLNDGILILSAFLLSVFVSFFYIAFAYLLLNGGLDKIAALAKILPKNF